MPKHENPQAFPHGDPTHGGDIGMTLRDWFAGQALAGFVAAPNDSPYGCVIGRHKKIPPEAISALAYELADAMLAEREKPNA